MKTPRHNVRFPAAKPRRPALSFKRASATGAARLLGVVFLVFACLLLPVGELYAAPVNFQVRVQRASTGEPIPDVQVIILEARLKGLTDEKGVARFRAEPGFYTVRAIVPGGRFKELRLRVQAEGQTLDVLMGRPRAAPKTGKPKKTIVGESGIRVKGSREKTRLSRYNISLDEIKRLPGVFGEALRGIETLPGISTPAFSAGSLIIRGANSNANFFLLDDLPIGYAFHMIGVNSVIHNDLIKSIDVYTGAYPVNFGDATGGIIAIETIDKVKKFGGNVSFSLWSANALFKGPFGGKGGYWIAAGRGSYLEKTLKPYIPDGFQAPRYGDGQLKIHVPFNPRHSITFHALGAKDIAGITVDSKPVWDPTSEPDPIFIGAALAINQAFHTEGLRYTYQPGSRFRNTAMLYYHNNIFFLEGRIGYLRARIKAENGYAAFKNKTEVTIKPRHIFMEMGVEGRLIQYRYNGATVRQIDPDDKNPDYYDTADPDFENVPVHDSQRSRYGNAYFMLVLKGGGFEFKPGVRVDYFGQTNHRVIAPRGTVSYTTKKKTSFIAGAGLYHRTPDPQTYSESSGNPNLKMERAEHYAVGIQQKIGRWTVKAEAYRHYFTDIVVVDPYETTPHRLNQDEKTRYDKPILYNDRLGWTNDGTGFSEGFEIFIKKTKAVNKPGIFGWLSYTWSRTLRNDHQHRITDEEKKNVYSADERRILNQYDNTKDIYANFDRTVIVNFVLGWRINEDWQFGARWKYATGYPYTPITGDDGGRTVNHGRVIFNPEYSKLENSERDSPYHSLDIRLDRFFNYGWGYANFYLEFINTYVRRNYEGQAYTRSLPFSQGNPRPQETFNTLSAPVSKGKNMRMPLFNFGIEMKF